MSSAIGPGDWVECVRDGSAVHGWSPLTVGAIYRVRDLVEEGYPGGRVVAGVTLHEVATPPGEVGFWIELFRPIYRPRADLIESLKAPAPDAVRELISEDA